MVELKDLKIGDWFMFCADIDNKIGYVFSVYESTKTPFSMVYRRENHKYHIKTLDSYMETEPVLLLTTNVARILYA